MRVARLLALYMGFFVLVGILCVRLAWVSLWPDGWAGGAVRWNDRTVTKSELEHFRITSERSMRGQILYKSGEPIREPLAVVGQTGKPDLWPVSDKVVAEAGRTGLQWSFDSVLQPNRPDIRAVLQVEHPYHGTGDTQTYYHMNPEPGASIRTTLDRAWQQVAEQSLQEAGVPVGAVVVLDVRSNQVLAMAGTKASFVGAPLALKAQTSGSIFKLVTAVAGLESHVVAAKSTTTCQGGLYVPGVRLRCWRTHGTLTMVEALAQSCDVAFAELGIRLGRAGIDAAVHQLGLEHAALQRVNGGPVLPGTEDPIVFIRPGNDAGLLANTAIGQEDVRLSPLDAAALARTIAVGGLRRPVQLVEDAERQGVSVLSYRTEGDHRVMSAVTAHYLTLGMTEAVRSTKGTAHALAAAPVPSAAKTGTAELSPRSQVNGWIVGFAPVQQPRIAYCVFVGRLPSVRAHAASIRIAKHVLTAYRQFQAHSVIG